MVTLLALPMNTGINFRDMVALRTAFYTQKIITKRKLLKIKLGGGEGRGEVTTGFHISPYLKTQR